MTDFWQAVGLLHLDRRAGLVALQRCFAAGTVPAGMAGAYRGRLIAVTAGPGLDLAVEQIARLWLPWQGKIFEDHGGRNLISAGGVRLLRMRFPGYRDLRAEPGGWTAFGFITSTGPSEHSPGVQVLRIDYRAVEDNPAPVRRVLDELVQVEEGRWLGQALVQWRRGLRRVGWFSLERPA